MANVLVLPQITYTPNAATGLSNVALSKPNSADFPVVQSSFPTTTDTFKTLTYQAPTEAFVKQQLSQYHSIMTKITGGTATEDDLAALTALIPNIRNYVLTEDDYNLMVTALANVETYVKNYIQVDLNNKATRLDQELKLAIDTINLFMQQLSDAYSNYPTEWPPVADGTIAMSKLDLATQAAINGGGATTIGTIVADLKPAQPTPGKACVWIDTNISDAD